jgi:hypothetical protein
MRSDLICMSYRKRSRYRYRVGAGVAAILAALFWFKPDTVQAESRTIQLNDGTEIVARQFGAGLPDVLWLPAESDFPEGMIALARNIARSGRSVLQADLLGAYLLPPLRSSIDAIPADGVSGLIGSLCANRGARPLVLMADGAGAVLVARAMARDTQCVDGIIWLSPNLYPQTPAPGTIAQYIPEASQLNLSIQVFQPDLSPWFWWRDRLAATLVRGGARVELTVIHGVRDRFYFRPDATPQEDEAARVLAPRIAAAITNIVEGRN